MGMIRRAGEDKTWTGNSHHVLNLLFLDSYEDNMSEERMGTLVKEYVKTDRFDGRISKVTVQRWIESNNITFEDLLVDWMELGLITEQTVEDSLKIKNYEDIVRTEKRVAERLAEENL